MFDEYTDDSDDLDWDEDDETLTVPCPSCGTDVYEDAEQCPSCGEYVVHDSSQWQSKPAWYIVLGLAGVVAVILALSGLAALF